MFLRVTDGIPESREGIWPEMSEWTFITNHGFVMAQIAIAPQNTARELARAVGITERTTLKIIADLESEGYIERQRVGRKNIYRIDPHIGLRHEAAGNVAVGDLLRVLGWKNRESRRDNGAP